MKKCLVVLAVVGLALLAVCAMTTPSSVTAGASVYSAAPIPSGATLAKAGAWYGQIVNSFVSALGGPALYAQDDEENADEEEAEEQKEEEPDTSIERIWSVVQFA